MLSLLNTPTYHKHQLKLVVQFILECECLMGEGVVTSPFLGEKKKYVSTSDYPENPDLGPSRITFGKKTVPLKTDLSPGQEDAWTLLSSIPSGRGGGTKLGEGEKRLEGRQDTGKPEGT